ncbi:MAG: hypothetical protein ABEI52_11620, partial [Halobacteriaceae archaeon]
MSSVELVDLGNDQDGEGADSPEPGWTGEVEVRRFLRDRVPPDEHDRRFRPTEPEPEKTEWRHQRDYADDLPKNPDAFTV